MQPMTFYLYNFRDEKDFEKSFPIFLPLSIPNPDDRINRDLKKSIKKEVMTMSGLTLWFCFSVQF